MAKEADPDKYGSAILNESLLPNSAPRGHATVLQNWEREKLIPFNKPSFSPDDRSSLALALDSDHHSGNGPFTKQAESLLSEIHGNESTALLTPSCTHALELAARLIDLQPGDEVIVPAYSFVTSASAFVWNGSIPKFADVDEESLDLDPDSVQERLTSRTRAICVVHYGGVAKNIEKLRNLADNHNLLLVEDNAHGLGGAQNQKTLGTFGTLSTLSFHETKNITCGEGGALLVNDSAYLDRALMLREKGTDRTRFTLGQVDKYTWQEVGSSWVLSDLLAALLVPQLENLREITATRRSMWRNYREHLDAWALDQGIRLMTPPLESEHPAHLFAMRFPTLADRDAFIHYMRKNDVAAVFHYQALNKSPQGWRLDPDRSCPVAERAADTLVRLPLFRGLTEVQQEYIIEVAQGFRLS